MYLITNLEPAGFRFFVTIFMAFVTATLFLRTNLHPDSVEQGNVCESMSPHAIALSCQRQKPFNMAV